MTFDEMEQLLIEGAKEMGIAPFATCRKDYTEFGGCVLGHVILEVPYARIQATLKGEDHYWEIWVMAAAAREDHAWWMGGAIRHLKKATDAACWVMEALKDRQ